MLLGLGLTCAAVDIEVMANIKPYTKLVQSSGWLLGHFTWLGYASTAGAPVEYKIPKMTHTSQSTIKLIRPCHFSNMYIHPPSFCLTSASGLVFRAVTRYETTKE